MGAVKLVRDFKFGWLCNIFEGFHKPDEVGMMYKVGTCWYHGCYTASKLRGDFT